MDINKLSFWFNSCCVCRLSTPPVRWLCRHCLKTLEQFFLSPRDIIRDEAGITHIRLFDWDLENDYFIRLFLTSLKKGGHFFIFQQMALALFFRLSQVRSLDKNTVLVPAPASSDRHFKDHAFCLASAFSHLSGFNVYSPLYRKTSPEEAQKRKNKLERRKILLYNKSELIIKPMIFVDDVLTTGATARAAYKALGEPENFMIITLAWRRFYHQI